MTQKHCEWCHKPFTGHWSRRYCCSNCARLAQNESVKRCQRKAADSKEPAVVVICDPLPYDQGGFIPGAAFDKLELKAMLETGSCAEGMRVRNGKREYRVVGSGSMQKLEAI